MFLQLGLGLAPPWSALLEWEGPGDLSSVWGTAVLACGVGN